MEFIGRVNQAAVSCADGNLTIWDLETFKLLRYVRMRDVQVGLRFCPSMGVLTSWGVDEFNHEIIVWDVDKLTVLHVLDGHSGAVKDTYEVAPAPLADKAKAGEKPWEPILGEFSATTRIHIYASVSAQNRSVLEVNRNSCSIVSCSIVGGREYDKCALRMSPVRQHYGSVQVPCFLLGYCFGLCTHIYRIHFLTLLQHLLR